MAGALQTSLSGVWPFGREGPGNTHCRDQGGPGGPPDQVQGLVDAWQGVGIFPGDPIHPPVVQADQSLFFLGTMMTDFTGGRQ